MNDESSKCPPEFDCLDKKLKSQFNNIEEAIKKFPKLPNPIKTYRGIKFNNPGEFSSALENYRSLTNQVFTLPSLTSSSLLKDIAEDFQEIGIMFEITARHGAYLDTISASKDEQEFLMSARAKYKVVKVEGSTVHLEQQL